MRFIWDQENISHIARHDVSPREAEEAMLSDSLLLDQQSVDGEERFVEIGFTHAARFLIVVYTLRGDAVRVVTAYSAPRDVIREYLESR